MLERLNENFGRLGAGDGEFAVDDEAGDALDAGLARVGVLGAHRLVIFVAFEITPDRRSIQTKLLRDANQRRDPTDIRAVEKICPEQRLDDRILLRETSRIADQAMSQNRVGRAFDLVERKTDAFPPAGFGYRLVHLPAGPVAEFEPQVLRAIHAFGRHVGIELERPPADLEIGRRRLGECALQPAFADEAPRTYRVRNDVDEHAPSLPAWRNVGNSSHLPPSLGSRKCAARPAGPQFSVDRPGHVG